MTNHLHSLVTLHAIAQEDGYIPSEGLSTIDTIVTYLLIPLGLFFTIALITWVLTGERKKKKSSSITSIE
jgi:SNF family Na+-dependent transporter